MKHTTVLVIVDTMEEGKMIGYKSAIFVPGLTCKFSRHLEGPRTRIQFATPEDLEAVTCGLHVDAVINLSSADPERFRDQLLPCLM